jgi:hypothetical protein
MKLSKKFRLSYFGHFMKGFKEKLRLTLYTLHITFIVSMTQDLKVVYSRNMLKCLLSTQAVAIYACIYCIFLYKYLNQKTTEKL